MTRKIMLALFVIAFALPSWAADTPKTAEPAKPAKSTAATSPDLIAALEKTGGFKTLGNLLGAAGLTDTFKGTGPFTLFAPTDAAFAKLPADSLEDWLKPQNKSKLRSVLTYHVIPGKLTVADFSGKQLDQSTLAGGVLPINGTNPDSATIGTAKISLPPLVAGNGVIYAIDSVQIPASVAGAM